MIVAELLCMGCMAQKGKAAVCAHCGYFDRGPENPLQLPPRTTLEGKYLIGRALGQGGFGITYLAWDLERNQKLAIKEYFPLQISTRAQDHLTVNPISAKTRNDLEYGLNKFAEEARSLLQFPNHPGIVSMVDFFYANGTAYIVMLYVEGQDLKEYLNHRGGKISYEAALKILLLIMDALEDVHRAGIIHRDISPDNIYVEGSGGVRILDFGATRYAMGEQSRSLSIVLKPGYAPEEQYRSRGKQGTWTDIYALGATFYRAITGRVPPEAPDRAIEDDLARPSAIGIAIPSAAEAALMKAMAVKAENRFQTVVAFREAMLPQRIKPQAPKAQPVVAPERDAPPAIVPPEPAPKAVLPKIPLLAAISILLFVVFVCSVVGTDGLIVALSTLPILFAVMMFTFARMWKTIQDGHSHTTPENAIAYCFIPLFNLYWAFPALWGFAKEYNAYVARHALARTRLNEGLFLTACIAYVAAWIAIPFGHVAVSVLILLNACLLLPVVAIICDAVNRLSSYSVAGSTAQSLFRLRCVSGEFEGKCFDVSAEKMIIGRNPSFASIVLSYGEVSGRHLRVWQDAANAGVWIEDLHSTNGTFLRKARAGRYPADWARVEGNRLLAVGDRFRLSRDGPEFEVSAS